ncbi:MAG TPA: SMI1/KNR4 family protein [Gemmatimonadaceae bacterium]|nr:SMI1/KNR4 family protein [Gemmatimonadaceae bacterium]
MTDWSRALSLIRNAGFGVGPGLSTAELSDVEERYGLRFPPDLRDLLSTGLPTGDGFPNWRDRDRTRIDDRLAWTAESVCFDIEHSAFWWPSWGPRPLAVKAACDLARQRIAEAPALIPLFCHRYLPAEPFEAGNPVFSAYQTDIICYGRDLDAWLELEFGRASYREATTHPRYIPFWSDLAESNNRPPPN